ncbi:SDR family NAD(P)-dependent oxidoreductase [Ruminobacter sp.]|uniref:SDR family NAD(P)-dependent oxidoreductase n=1 Tax=Ruminobacter sp. TaxID=2774296 RepID=UPI0038704AC4
MIFSVIIQILLFLLVAFFVVFTCYEVFEGRKNKNGSARDAADPTDNDDAAADSAADDSEYDTNDVPKVSILLPVCNETAVVGQLIQAVSQIEYVDGAYEILLLDDSDPENAEIIKRTVDNFNTFRGMSDGADIEDGCLNSGYVRYHSREDRDGFKAGNITYGLSKAKGDLIVIFDADCIPPSDFLMKTVPCFNDKSLGFLQTAISFRNKNANFLTRFLEGEISHKDGMTENLNKTGDLVNITGSSCVWRRKCLDDVGGFSDRTLTEDIDICYRAQLQGWNCRYLADTVSEEELPENMSAVRLQRHRWAYGLVKNAFLHVGEVIVNTSFSVSRKVNAVLMMSQTFLLASFYALLLLTVPAVLVSEHLGCFFDIVCTVFLITAIVWGCNSVGGIDISGIFGCTAKDEDGDVSENDKGKEKAEDGSVPASSGRGFWEYVAYVFMYLPLSLYYFMAIFEVSFGVNVAFVPTPKGGAKLCRNRVSLTILILEIVSFVYALFGVMLSIGYGNCWTLLYTSICTAGFGISLFLSITENYSNYLSGLKHVVITGATGEIGGALARKFARRGMHLTLSGRNEDKLREVKAECERLGAEVDIKVLDLRNTDELREWGHSLGDTLPVDLLIANAGLNTNIGEDLEGEPFEEAKALVEVNLLSDIALIDSVLPAMRKRRKGQIAILSSLASYYGLVYTPTYCATKAALRNYGNSLRAWLKPEGIKINVILPGYIDSPMCRAMPGPKPFLMHSDKAAGIIARGLYLNLARISFPFPLNLGIWSLSFLPHCLAAPIAALFGYGRMK